MERQINPILNEVGYRGLAEVYVHRLNVFLADHTKENIGWTGLQLNEARFAKLFHETMKSVIDGTISTSFQPIMLKAQIQLAMKIEAMKKAKNQGGFFDRGDYVVAKTDLQMLTDFSETLENDPKIRTDFIELDVSDVVTRLPT